MTVLSIDLQIYIYIYIYIPPYPILLYFPSIVVFRLLTV